MPDIEMIYTERKIPDNDFARVVTIKDNFLAGNTAERRVEKGGLSKFRNDRKDTLQKCTD